jgi:signal transduction histidine kinase
MRRLKWLFQPVLIFVVAQVSWALLMFVWIRWYLMRNQEIDALLQHFPLRDSLATGQMVVLIEGCLLMAIILIGLYFIFVSLRKQTRLNKLQDSILSSVTHELRTPLSSIRLYAETMLLRPLSDSERSVFLHRTLSEAERLQKLIETVLISARLASDGIPRQLEREDVVSVALTSWRRVVDRVGAKRLFHIDTEVNTPDGQWITRCNAHELGIVFDNLLDNAVKYTNENGRVQMKIEATETHLRVKISDDGMGIEKKDLRRIFDRFFRAEKNSLKRVHGSGLGLFVCRTIIKAHQGRIYAASEGPGKGSAFYVEFSGNSADS